MGSGTPLFPAAGQTAQATPGPRPFPAPANPQVRVSSIPPSALRINPITGTAGTGATQILENNHNRVQWTVVNLTANTIYVGFDDSVSSSRGIPAGANGGSVSSLFREDGELCFQALWVIAPSGSGAIYVVETIADDISKWLQLLFTST